LENCNYKTSSFVSITKHNRYCRSTFCGGFYLRGSIGGKYSIENRVDSLIFSECCDLVVNVLEAKDLIESNRTENVSDSYVRVFLLPDKEATIQTKVYRGSNSPSYKERFLFSLNPREQSQRSLCFHVYSTDLLSHTLIGEGEIRLGDISLRQPVTTWVTLTDTGQVSSSPLLSTP
jgi:hypothetical protein